MVNSRDAIEEIRSRISVTDLVSEYVTIKRAGKSSKGLCPFHAEKTPSFTVNDDFGTWHCFGCGEHGDIFSFLMKMENLTFAETLERLAKRAGVELDQYQNRQTSRKDILVKINAQAAAYYFEQLRRTPAALEYLRGRGLADQTIERFRLGYASPAWDGLIRYAGNKGINIKDAEEAGLVIKNDRGGFYDRFRHRIIFPIFDIQERMIGFGGRGIGDDQPKYLNSPETPLFSKTRSLYGLNLGRKSIADNGCAIVVEGYMDVITAHQAGFTNCIATLGTALTLDHISVLSRYTKNIVLAYDADSAGIKAALRGASMFDEAECDVRITRLPGGEDPDSLLQKGRIAEFDAAITNALPIPGYKLAILRDKYDLSRPAGRTAMLKEATKVLAEIPAFADRESYIKEIASYHPNWGTGTTRAEDHIRADVDALVNRRHAGTVIRRSAPGTPKPVAALDKAEQSILRILIVGGAESEHVFGAITPESFTGEINSRAAQLLFEMFAEKKGIYLPELLEKADEDLGRFISELAMRDEGPPIIDKALQDCLALIKNSRVRQAKASDVMAPYIKDGLIDPNYWSGGQPPGEYADYLKKSGRLTKADE